MQLHPTERPADIEEFRRSLFAGVPLSTLRPVPHKHTLQDYLRLPLERTLLYITGGLLLFSLLIA